MEAHKKGGGSQCVRLRKGVKMVKGADRYSERNTHS